MLNLDDPKSLQEYIDKQIEIRVRELLLENLSVQPHEVYGEGGTVYLSGVNLK